MKSITLVVVDTMTFTYLQGLGTLEILSQISRKTKGIAVTAAVVKQLHRSGRLGPLVQSFCHREEMKRISPVLGDAVSKEVAKTLQKKDGLLVRRDRVDVELVEVARQEGGGVLTSERGILRLCERKNVLGLDLVVFLAWAVHLGLLSDEQCDDLTAPWGTKAAAGTGCPPDYAVSYSKTAASRIQLEETVKLLPFLLEE